MVITDFIKSMACLTAWREENINKLNGMTAVLFALRNRFDAAPAGGFKKDWLANIASHGQFSSMTILGDGQTVHYPDPRDPEFIQLLQVVDGIYDGTTVDKLTSGALFYSDMTSPSYTKGGWFDRNIAGNPEVHPRVAQVGSTTYFK